MHHLELGDRFNFWYALADAAFQSILEFNQVLQPHGVYFLSVWVLSRHGNLLGHITEDDDHKGQTDGQAHRLDDAVEFVSGEEFDVTAHNLFILSQNLQNPQNNFL
jgi:hypothetical protein